MITKEAIEAGMKAAIDKPLDEDDVERIITDALAAMPGAAETEIVRHKKRGTTYDVIAKGRFQVDGDLDMEKVTVYRGQDGQVWVRPDYEFNDGRFEVISALTPATDLAAENERLRAALERQGDNMAFVINHATLPEQWMTKFMAELAEDRAALERT